MRDHLLGFPPVLLSLDPEPRASHVTPPRGSKGQSLETMAQWAFRAGNNACVFKDGEPFYVTEADCRQIKPAAEHVWEITAIAYPPFSLETLRQMVGKLIRVQWTDELSDWPYWTVLSVGPNVAELKGADFPDGSAKHDGGIEFVFAHEIASAELVGGPPSTKPAGVWRKTSEMKPPKPGVYMIKVSAGMQDRRWDGCKWWMNFPPDEQEDAVDCAQSWHWLDESTSPQADADRLVTQ